MRSGRVHVVLIAAAVLLAARAVGTQAPPLPATAADVQSRQKPAVPAAFARVLTESLQFSSSDVSSLARGSTVSKSLPSSEPREVAVVGGLWVNAPLAYFLSRAKNIVTFKTGEEIQQIGVFAKSATPVDLQTLTLDPQDVADLRRCVPGECKVKFDATALTRFAKEVNWASPDAAAHANRVARDVLAGYVAAYQRDGNAALIEYRDRDRGTRVADGAKALLDRSAWLDQAAPGLRQYMDGYPRATHPGVEDFIYWSKEAFGMKPTISATHMIFWCPPGGAADAVMLSKEIFATHYLEASMSVTLLATDGRTPGGVFVIYLNRSLVDMLQGGGLFGPLRRQIARSKTREGLADHLETLKKRVETAYQSVKLGER